MLDFIHEEPYKFIGRNGSMGLATGKIYRLRKYANGPHVVVEWHVNAIATTRCPYISERTFAENWERQPCERRECVEARAELAELREEKRKWYSEIHCAYCGELTKAEGDESIMDRARAHILVCPQHPYAEANQRAEKAEDELGDMQEDSALKDGQLRGLALELQEAEKEAREAREVALVLSETVIKGRYISAIPGMEARIESTLTQARAEREEPDK